MTLDDFRGLEYGLNVFYEIIATKERTEPKKVNLLFKEGNTYFYAQTYLVKSNGIKFYQDEDVKTYFLGMRTENESVFTEIKHLVYNNFSDVWGSTLNKYKDNPSFILRKIKSLVKELENTDFKKTFNTDKTLYNVEFLDGTKIDFIDLSEESKLDVVGFKIIEKQ